MLTQEERRIKDEILTVAGVTPFEEFDVKDAIRNRIDYLKNYIRSNNRKGIVLGISGGVDSSTAGKLSQIAMQELRDEGYEAYFIAMRLPYKVQLDEDEAQDALAFIQPDRVVTTNIGNGTDGIFDSVTSSLYDADLGLPTSCTNDFAKGNVKARMRMIAQFSIAGMHDMLVLGTDHNAEFVAGFYTYH